MADTRVIEMPEPEGLTPMERTLWLYRTHPDRLDYGAFGMWYDASDYFPNGEKAKGIWDALPDADKQPWKDRFMASLEEFAAMSEPERQMANRTARWANLKRNNEASARLAETFPVVSPAEPPA